VAAKSFSGFKLRKQGGAAIWFIPESIGEEFAVLLEDPDALFRRPGAQIVKDQLKIKVGRVPIRVAGQDKYVYLKRFNAFSWRYRLGSLVVPSAALRALHGACVLKEAEIPSARAIAALEFRRGGMLSKSFFVSDEIVGGKTVDAYWRKDLRAATGAGAIPRRRNFLRRLAALFRCLHDRNIYHKDLKDGNILVVPGDEHRPEAFFLLDLEGIRRYRRLSWRRRINNLVQLNRTLGLYLRDVDKGVFADGYLSGIFADPGQKKRWITTVLRHSREKDRRKPGRRRGRGRRQ
jgi:hypothetical protein